MDPYLEASSIWPDVHASARYERRIDYRKVPLPPELSADDAAWIDLHLHAHVVRQ